MEVAVGVETTGAEVGALKAEFDDVEQYKKNVDDDEIVESQITLRDVNSESEAIELVTDVIPGASIIASAKYEAGYTQ